MTDQALKQLPKSRTGIAGLDEATGGGLPCGRVSLVVGGPGCGKTLLGLHFIVMGARDYDEPGVILSFEESKAELIQNVASLGFDLVDLEQSGRLRIEQFRTSAERFTQVGEFNLEALLVRLDAAARAVGARRVMVDSCDALFGTFADQPTLRAELHRFFAALKERGLTTLVTGEIARRPGERPGLEQYVSDCVLHLDHRVIDQVSTRRLRIVKYRGSAHGTNEYPFLIDAEGIAVLPITGLGLDHAVFDERLSTGIPRLDDMLTGGIYRGSSILISGTAGTGKTTFAVCASEAACQRGERTLYLSFEESPEQILRNMRSVGVDLHPYIQTGLLLFHTVRPTTLGLEAHLVAIDRLIERHRPAFIVLDPITAFIFGANEIDVRAMLTRLMDYMKQRGITAVMTNLVSGASPLEVTATQVSSLVDIWVILRDIETNAERNRSLIVLKARGTGHSNQVREFMITSSGIEITDPYVGPGGVATGSARLAQEAADQAAQVARDQELQHLEQTRIAKRQAFTAQLEWLQAAFTEEQAEIERSIEHLHQLDAASAASRAALLASRKGDMPGAGG